MTEIGNGTLVYHAGVTISRALTGFLLAALVGIPFAAAMARSVLVRNLFEPIFFIGYPIPKIALFPVFTYIFGIGTPSKIAFTFIECLYPIVVACYFGFRAVQTRLVWSAQNCGASRAIILSRVILPAALPSIFAGLRVALPVAIIVVVITEMIGELHRARILHHDLEHALHLRQRLRRDHRHRHLWPRARSGAAAVAPPRGLLAAGGGVNPNEAAAVEKLVARVLIVGAVPSPIPVGTRIIVLAFRLQGAGASYPGTNSPLAPCAQCSWAPWGTGDYFNPTTLA